MFTPSTTPSFPLFTLAAAASAVLALSACGTGGGSADVEIADQCTVAEDCGNWVCHCDDGQAVNSRNCTNGSCLHADDICADTCNTFGSTWSGDYTPALALAALAPVALALAALALGAPAPAAANARPPTTAPTGTATALTACR